MERGYPWLTYGAIIFLEGIINKNFKILEFGSGGSTVFFANNCHSVKSYETNSLWYEKVKQRTDVFKNVNLIKANPVNILQEIAQEPENYYDLVLIDIDPKDFSRILTAESSISKIKSGGFLVIDNYLKFGMKDFIYPKGDIYTFDELHYSGLGTKICQLN